MLTLYNVVSSDGYIARKDGSEDFIADDLWINFLNLCREYGTIILGRKSYDIIQSYDTSAISAFEFLPVKKIVISANKDFIPKRDYVVAHSPEEAYSLAPNALVSSGPTINNYLLKNGMVKKVILHKVPTVISEGIEPFETGRYNLVPIEDVQKLGGINICEFNVLPN